LSFPSLFTVSGVFGLAAIVLYALAVRRIRRNHPKLYAQLDHPDHLYSDPLPQYLQVSDDNRRIRPHYGNVLFANYLLRCQFMNEGDSVLALIGTFWYLSLVLAVGSMLWEWM
jgi:hypothetical protein